jgi:hypothetical protein
MVRFEFKGPLGRDLRHLPPEYFRIPMGTIRRLEKMTVRGKKANVFAMEIHAKDVRIVVFEFPDEHSRDRIFQVGCMWWHGVVWRRCMHSRNARVECGACASPVRLLACADLVHDCLPRGAALELCIHGAQAVGGCGPGPQARMGGVQRV